MLALSLLLLSRPSASSSTYYPSLIGIRDLLSSDPPVSRTGNLNEVLSGGEGEAEDATTLLFLPYLQPFSGGDGRPFTVIGTYEGLAASALAMEHLNTGNSSILKEVAGLNERCPIRFAADSFDTELSQKAGVDWMIRLIADGAGSGLFPAAVLGAASSRVSVATSIISGLSGVLQLSGISTSPQLDDKSQFSLFGRTIPNDDGTSIPLLAQMSAWGVRYLAVLHMDDAYGNGFANGIRLAAETIFTDIKIQTFDIPVGASDSTISDAVASLRRTQFTYFFGIIEQTHVERVMSEAYRQGIAGDGVHNWLFSDAFGSTVTGGESWEEGSPLAKSYSGTGILSAVGGVEGMEKYDLLGDALRSLRDSEADIEFLDGIMPSYPEGHTEVDHTIYTKGDQFLKSQGMLAPFLYDATISVGLAACDLYESTGGLAFTGAELFARVLNTTFEGTSGTIVLDPDTGTRDPTSALFIMTNFVPDPVNSTHVSFKGVNTDLFESGSWRTLEPYVFGDGTTDVPSDLPKLELVEDRISPALLGIMLALCALVILLSLASVAWTRYFRMRRVVRSSQPIFLSLISAGVALMALGIVPLSIEGSDVACMTTPWLLFLGFTLTFSALFTKTYRINQIMKNAAKFKRLTLTATDVMKPMLALLLVNVVILVAFTAVSPLQSNTIVVDTDPFGRNIDTYYQCGSDKGPIFLGILAGLNIAVLLFAILQCWHARKISTELSESQYIFSAISIIIMASFLGIPVSIIARDNVNAFYFVASGLIVVVCLSILLLIYAPKVHVLRSKEDAKKRKSDVTSTNSTSSAADGMKIINLAAAQAELEEEVKELRKRMENEAKADTVKNRTSIRSSVGSGASSMHEDMDDLEQAQTRAVSFCDDNEPLGRVTSSQEAESIVGDDISSG